MFKNFKLAIARQFARMCKHRLLRTNTPKDAMWAVYLGSFPEGADPIQKERTLHDCNCCKSFIRTMGDTIAIIDGKIETIWDIKIGGVYQVVADAMAARVKADAIADKFLQVREKTTKDGGTQKVGIDQTFQQLIEKNIQTWEHFFVTLPSEVVVDGKEIGPELNKARTTAGVMLRGLTELNVKAIASFNELNAQGSLYRGDEQKFVIGEFKKLKQAFDKLKTDAERQVFVWDRVGVVADSVACIRGSAVGTLLIDLADPNVDIEVAVKKWESKMAPEHYKRPNPIVTPKMLEDAKLKMLELGLMTAMQRRYATLADITISNIIFANRSSKAAMLMNSTVFDDLIKAQPEKVKKFDKVEEVGIEKFLADILPNSESIEVMFENRHTANLVSLIAPEDPTAGELFKWPSKFSWAYNGSLADSEIRKAVQAAGGRVDGAFRFSHSWNHNKRNASLMDIYVFMPGFDGKYSSGGYSHDMGKGRYVGWHKRNDNASGGSQDVDYVNAAPAGYVPVENITFPNLSKMPEGTYVCRIHNYQLRSPTEGGFKAEIEFGGELFQYEYDKPLRNHEWVTVAEVTLKDGQFTIKHHLPETASVKTEWGLQSQSFHKVNVVMYSPNHWDGVDVGNKHYFFMLDGCVQPGSARGFFNEFLKSELDPYRKVFELVGSKMQTPESDEQLSGLGFSSTQRNDFLCRVTGNSGIKRVIKVKV